MKIDKLPFIDPNVRGIYDLLIETAARIRRERKAQESMSHHHRALAAQEQVKHQQEKERKLLELKMQREFIASFSEPKKASDKLKLSLPPGAAKYLP